MERGYDQGPRIVPVQEGEEYDVVIEAVGEKGDGIAKVKNFVLFVPGTKKGDRVRIRITKVFKSVGFAEVIRKAAPVEGPEETQEPYHPDEEPPVDESPEEISEDFGEDE